MTKHKWGVGRGKVSVSRGSLSTSRHSISYRCSSPHWKIWTETEEPSLVCSNKWDKVSHAWLCRKMAHANTDTIPERRIWLEAHNIWRAHHADNRWTPGQCRSPNPCLIRWLWIVDNLEHQKPKNDLFVHPGHVVTRVVVSMNPKGHGLIKNVCKVAPFGTVCGQMWPRS